MKKTIEERIGVAIPNSVYEKGVANAEKKLQSLILRFGDANGVRRTPEYLEELVIEAVKSELLTEYTQKLMGIQALSI